MSVESSSVGAKMRSQLHHGAAGVGFSTPELPRSVVLKIEDFRGGYDVGEDEFNIPDNASPDCLDVELDSQGFLRRMPGLGLNENLAPHDPKELFTHGNLDNSIEIVMFDSPFMGIKQGNHGTNWYNVALPTGDGWTATNHGGDLIFSNGVTSVYKRAPQATTISNLGWGPAQALLSFAGRVFAGGVTISGIYNPLGMFWTGASGEPDDTGLGSGAELLLSETAEGDRIVGLRAMGFDLMAIFMRKALWIGRRTGDPLRPADFAPKVSGVGAISNPAISGGPGGVLTFLSDDGIKVFDGAGVSHISKQIDDELLPIDYSRIRNYSIIYSPITGKLKVFTPFRTFIYDFRYGYWMRSSAIINRAAILFNPATLNVSDLPAGWGLYWDGAWSESVVFFGLSTTGLVDSRYLPRKHSPHFFSFWGGESPTSDVIVADLVYLVGTSLCIDTLNDFTYLGQPQDPYWTTKAEQAGEMDQLFKIQNVMLEYMLSGKISFEAKNSKGKFVSLLGEKTLGLVEEPTVRELSLFRTMRDSALRLRITGGNPLISRFNAKLTPRGRGVGQ